MVQLYYTVQKGGANVKNLKILRTEQGYTQNQIAQFMHTGNSTVFRWEQGITQPTLYQFIKLCHILKCTPSELMGNIEKDQIPVFSFDFSLTYKEAVTAELYARKCVFGIILPYDISPRIKSGDICFFSLDNGAEKESIVFYAYDCCNGQISIYKEYDTDMQIIAVCQLLHSKL